MSIKSTFALLTVLTAAAALPAPALAASTAACSLEGRYDTTRSALPTKPRATAGFLATGTAVCTGVVGGQPINPRATPFRIEGWRSSLLGQGCVGSGQAQLTLRLLKRTGWVPLRAQVRMVAAEAGTLDGATQIGRDAVSLLGSTGLTTQPGECSGAFGARFALVPTI